LSLVVGVWGMLSEDPAEGSNRLAIFLSGLPGSGKTRIIDAALEGLAAPAVVLDLDKEIARHPLYDPTNVSHIYDDRAAYDWADGLVEDAFQAHLRDEELRTLVVDGTGTKVDRRLRRMAEAKHWGFRTVLMYVNVTLETALARNSRRRERVVPISVMTAYHDLIEDAQGIARRYVDCFVAVNNNADIHDRTLQITVMQRALADVERCLALPTSASAATRRLACGDHRATTPSLRGGRLRILAFPRLTVAA